MIVVGGGGLALLVVLAVTLLFLALPFLLLRAAVRRAPAPFENHEPFEAYGPAAHWATPSLPEVTEADVRSLRNRLGSDLLTLDAGRDAVARQAMADAAERHATAGALLERARSTAQLRTAWLAAVEGLAATRVVRTRLGLDPGPDLPALPSAGRHLTGPTPVDVDGRTVVGEPDYAPGRPHYFPGGRYEDRDVPSGWYAAPFWPAALLGGLGGWALGGLATGALGGYGGDGSDGGDGFGGFGGGSGWDGGADLGGGEGW